MKKIRIVYFTLVTALMVAGFYLATLNDFILYGMTMICFAVLCMVMGVYLFFHVGQKVQEIQMVAAEVRVLLNKGEYKAAIILYERLFEYRLLRPYEETMKIAVAMLNHKLGKVKKAKDILEPLTSSFEALQKLGYIHLQEQDLEKALEYYEKGLVLNGTDQSLWVGKAACQAGLESLDKAKETLQEALEAVGDGAKDLIEENLQRIEEHRPIQTGDSAVPAIGGMPSLLPGDTPEST